MAKLKKDTLKIKPLHKIKVKPISYYKKLADRKFSEFIRQRDWWRCITCWIIKPWKEMQNWHYITRWVIALRYDERNNNCQCFWCNIFKKWNYTVYAIKMMEKHWDDILYELDEIVKESKRNITKHWRDFYQNIIKQYS